MSMLDPLVTKRDAILALAVRYGATNVRVFGSVAPGDATPDPALQPQIAAILRALDEAPATMTSNRTEQTRCKP